MFNVEPLPPSTVRLPNLDSRSSPISMNAPNAAFLSNSDANYGLRQLDFNADQDANIDNGREDDGEVSELDELPPDRIVRTINRSINNIDEDAQDPLRNEDNAHDGESDNEYNFVEAESDSDSDDNTSNQDAQRNVLTGPAAVASETGEEFDFNLFFFLLFN